MEFCWDSHCRLWDVITEGLSTLYCVYRHHTNPVGTEWRWKMDQPELILKEAIENHQNMIKQFKGIFLLVSLVYLPCYETRSYLRLALNLPCSGG